MTVSEMLEYDRRRFREDEVNPDRLLTLGFTHGLMGYELRGDPFGIYVQLRCEGPSLSVIPGTGYRECVGLKDIVAAAEACAVLNAVFAGKPSSYAKAQDILNAAVAKATLT